VTLANARLQLPTGNTLALNGGSLVGQGNLTGHLWNDGAVVLTGTNAPLIVSGNYTQAPSGRVQFELSSSAFDSLRVSNTAVLNGTFELTLKRFYPPADSLFPFLSAATRSGTFSSVNYPSNVIGIQVNYSPTGAVMEVINTLPVVSAIAAQAVDESTLLAVNILATDNDAPGQSLSYSLLNPPAGATVNSSGLVTWTPTEMQGPGTNTITALVTDNGTPNLTSTQAFVVVVREVNLAPSITLPANQVVNELTSVALQASATDPDLPANGLTFQLVSGPSGLVVSTNGAITWTPGEAQGSNVHTVVVRVFDNNPAAVNATSLSATNSFTITVHEVNLPPSLDLPPTQIVTEETPLNISASATDPDLPANALTFWLLSPPAGMSINANSGAISWTPTEAQGSNAFIVTVVVRDTNSAAVNARSFSVTNSFTVVVNESNRPPALALPANATIHAQTIFSNSATATDMDLPTNTLTFALVSGPIGAAVTPSGAITWRPTDAQAPSNHVITLRVFDNGAPSLSDTQSFVISVVSRPQLFPPVATPTNVVLQWMAIPGTAYRVQFLTNLNVTNWMKLSPTVTAATSIATNIDAGATNSQRFYRVQVLP
jgi:hypothetical protein